ncbi:MAG: hypothetical protein DRO96_01075 [Candidatus Aenigmatarchaeota archaeon]|nr:MAG: hypothetical protein DRO96_01075 [Candidatus Aenigmarchaeota archaeon]
MVQIETNIFIIENLQDLNCQYHVYQVRGLAPGSDDYAKNTQLLTDKLSSITMSPCHVFHTKDGTFIARPEGFPKEMPEDFTVIRTSVKITKIPHDYELKFDELTPETRPMAIRFLTFSINSFLGRLPALWRPGAGEGFFHKSPDKYFNADAVELFKGFKVRPVMFSDGRIGLCVDIRSKYLAKDSLPTEMDKDTFIRHYKGQKCVYEYGNIWYETRMGALNDLNANEINLPYSNETLFEHVHNKAGQHKSQRLLKLPPDSAVIVYYNSFGEARNMPAGLCRLTYSTEHPEVSRHHNRTIKPPYIRRREICFVVDKYLRNIPFGSNSIRLSQQAYAEEEKRYGIPDLLFGNNKVLTIRQTSLDNKASLEKFGRKKQEYYSSDTAGPYTKKQFDRQYIMLPQSVQSTFGPQLVNDIKREVNQLFPDNKETRYEPTIIAYNDSVQLSIHNICREIISAIDGSRALHGYAVVMIPERGAHKHGKEDEIANAVIRKLRKRDIIAAVIHTGVSSNSYEQSNGQWRVTFDRKRQGRLKGYLRNVVLNKILILNHFWPFVLKTPLHADLTIGIDVKGNIAGFTLVYKSGEQIRFFPSESDDKERLGKAHIKARVEEILKEESATIPLKTAIKKIVIQRQGRLFYPEQAGITQAIDALKQEGVLAAEASCTFVEVQKTSMIPFRIFEVSTQPETHGERIEAPFIGTYVQVSENEGFLTTTGQPYKLIGTAKPIHITKREGPIPLEQLMEDIFMLTNLTWTKIDYCARDPLTVKMNDIWLREIAGDYDRNALKFSDESGEGKEGAQNEQPEHICNSV